MAFCPVCLGILPYSCQNTSRNITCEQLLNCFLQHMLVFSSTILSFVLCRIVSVIIFCWNIIRFSEKKKNLPFICRLLKKDFCSDLIIIYCQSKLNCIFHIPNRNAHPACRLLWYYNRLPCRTHWQQDTDQINPYLYFCRANKKRNPFSEIPFSISADIYFYCQWCSASSISSINIIRKLIRSKILDTQIAFSPYATESCPPIPAPIANRKIMA